MSSDLTPKDKDIEHLVIRTRFKERWDTLEDLERVARESKLGVDFYTRVLSLIEEVKKQTKII